MTPKPVTVDSTSTVQDAADLMVAADVRHLPVVTHGTLVGMISDRDLRSYVLEHMFFHSPLLAICGSGAGKNEITFAQVHTCCRAPRRSAMPTRHAPDTGELIGMVRYIDVLRAIRPFV